MASIHSFFSIPIHLTTIIHPSPIPPPSEVLSYFQLLKELQSFSRTSMQIVQQKLHQVLTGMIEMTSFSVTRDGHVEL